MTAAQTAHLQQVQFRLDLLLILLVLLAGLLAWLAFRNRTTRLHLLILHATGRNRILEKAESLEALQAFFTSEVGRELLAPPSLATGKPTPVLGLRMFQWGVACLSFGLGFAAITGFLIYQSLAHPESVQHYRRQARGHSDQAILLILLGGGLMVGAKHTRRLHLKWTLEDRTP